MSIFHGELLIFHNPLRSRGFLLTDRNHFGKLRGMSSTIKHNHAPVGLLASSFQTCPTPVDDSRPGLFYWR